MGSSGGGNAGLPSVGNSKGGTMANNQNPGLGSYGGGSTFGGISKNQAGIAHPQGPPAFPSYKYGGLGGGIGGGLGGIGGGTGAPGGGADPYNANYQQNSQGAQGSIGSSGSGVRGGGVALGSRGSDFKLPSVSNKMAMGGMRGLPGMPGSKGGQPGSKGLESRGSRGGAKPPMAAPGAASFKSNLGAGYNAFNVPKYGSGNGLGGGLGGGIGGMSSYGSGGLGLGGNGSAGGLGLAGASGGFGSSSNVDLNNNNNMSGGLGGLGSSQSRRVGSRNGSVSGLGRHKF